MNITFTASPNFNERTGDVNMIVLHYTGMESGDAALERMCDPESKVSAHFMVWEDGEVSQLVGEDKRAWHAGVGGWQGDGDINSCSIGIEIVNGGHNVPLADGSLPPYPETQIQSVIALCDYLRASHIIPHTRIVGHSDIAPARKEDPGEHFPWKTLAENGLGIWPAIDTGIENETLLIGTGLLPGDSGEPVTRLQAELRSIGYGIKETGSFDETTGLVVKAFQRRWVQDRVTGHADLTTLRMISAVAKAYASSTFG